MARNGAWVEAVLERFRQEQTTRRGIEINLAVVNAAPLIANTSQHILDWKAACEADDLEMMKSTGSLMWADYDEITATFPGALAPTGNETDKP